MKDVIEICGTPIETKSIKSYRIEQKEYIYRPVFREIPPKNFLFRAIYRFEKMEPYAAIIEEDKPNSLMFWKKHERKKYECVNAAGRKMSIYLDEVPVLVHLPDGHTSEVFKDNKNYALMEKDKTSCIEIVEALVIEGKQDYIFYGNNIHLYSVLDNYNRIKEALKKKKNEKTESEKTDEKKNNDKKNIFSAFTDAVTGVFRKGEDSKAIDAEDDKGLNADEVEENIEVDELSNQIAESEPSRSVNTSEPMLVPVKTDYAYIDSGVKEYSTKLSDKGIMVLVGGAVFLLGLIGYIGSMLGHKGKIQVPNSAKKLCGNQYEEVVEMFENKGFKNISTKKDEDLITGWVNSEGEVEDVIINGDSSFGEDAWYTSDAEIVIVYHAFPSKDVVAESETEETAEAETTFVEPTTTTETTTTEATTTESLTTEKPKIEVVTYDGYSKMQSFFAQICKGGYKQSKCIELAEAAGISHKDVSGAEQIVIQFSAGGDYVEVSESDASGYISEYRKYTYYSSKLDLYAYYYPTSSDKSQRYTVDNRGHKIELESKSFDSFDDMMFAVLGIPLSQGDSSNQKVIEQNKTIEEIASTETVTTDATTTEVTTTTEATTEATTAEEKHVYDFVVNRNNGRFHMPDCKHVLRMKDSNKSYVSATYDDMINWGYDPCDDCIWGLH